MNDEFDPLDPQKLEKALSESARRALVNEQLEVEDLLWVMSHKVGRRAVARLLERAGVWRSSFHSDALQMAFSEGERNMGLRLLDLIANHCPDQLLEMLKESHE